MKLHAVKAANPLACRGLDLLLPVCARRISALNIEFPRAQKNGGKAMTPSHIGKDLVGAKSPDAVKGLGRSFLESESVLLAESVKKVAAIHDLSCIGRCSLTVILPILSCMGIQVCPLPTAVLSTHPGGFAGVCFCDFTGHILDFSAHWRREGVRFDCIYSGFLASEEQIGVVAHFIDEFSFNRPLVLVDPVMGDDGKLYSICTDTMKESIKALVKKADVITPNYTEACFLLGESWQPVVAQVESLNPWLVRISEMGPPRVVVTGVPLPDNKIANLGYDRIQNKFWQFTSDLIPAKYPGTGDIFASVLLGELLGGASLPEAISRAGDFVSAAVFATFAAGTPTREGILLEKMLPQLCCNRNVEKYAGGQFK